jgi:SYP6 family syntaxin
MSLRAGASRPFDDDDDDDFYATKGAGETQRLLVREQDDAIRSLASSVERVQGMAVMVNEELTSQNRLLDELDDDVEKTDSRLKMLNTQLRKLAYDQDRGKYCVILILLIVLIILTMLVLA